jgi:hypothetical protein
VGAVIKPFPQVLPRRLPEAQGKQGRGHRILTGALSQDSAIHPESQAPLLCWPQVGKMLGNALVHLVPFTGKAHDSPPHPRCLTLLGWKERSALFCLFLDEFQHLHTPVSP